MLNYHNSQQNANGGFLPFKTTCPCGKSESFTAFKDNPQAGTCWKPTCTQGVLNKDGASRTVNFATDVRSASKPFTQQYNTPQGNVALMPQSTQPEKPKPKFPQDFKKVETYHYEGFEVHRFETFAEVFKRENGKPEKTFRQYKPNTTIPIGDEIRRVLYRRSEVLKAIQQGKTIYIPEGERKVHSLEQRGLVGTCNAGGAGKGIAEFKDTLRGANVVILPDNDDAGKHHAEKIVNSILGIAASVKVVSLRNLPPKGDVTDFFNSGGTLEQLLKEAQETPEISRPIVNLPELTPEQEYIDNFTLENAPEIPFHSYAALPPFLKEPCETFTESHEKAVFLTAALPVCAAHMPNVVTRNADRFHTLDFYAAIVARAGSGKGKAEFAFRLASVTDAYILKTSQDKFEAWKNENTLREQKGRFPQRKSNRKASEHDSENESEEKRHDSEPEKPHEPMPIVRGLAIPANTPATPFIRKLKANGGRGLVKESEIDVLNGTLKQDWGALLDSFLRQAFHHETYSFSRTQTKDSDESESRIENPQVSVVLTGTENQMIRLLGKGGIENGLYSRFALYCLEAPDVWQSRRPSVKFDERESLFKSASEKLFQLWKLLSVHQSLEIKLTDEQFDLIDCTFAALRSEWRLRNHDIAIITQRSALIAQRIIGVLTVLRNIDCELYKTDELIPTDSDAQTGVELAVIYFEHAARFAVNRLNSRITNNTDKLQKALELHAQGLSYREIAAQISTQFGEISYGGVRKWILKSDSVNSVNQLTVNSVNTTEQNSGFKTFEIPEPEPLRSASKPTPAQLQPESLELVSTDELNAGFFGERTTAKFNLIKAICEGRNISGSEAGTLIKNSIAYGLLHDTGNDKYERCDL